MKLTASQYLTTGNVVSVMSFDSGEGPTEKTSTFDTYAQIIEGKTEIVIDNVLPIWYKPVKALVIPAHTPTILR